ncbi:MAG TPA: AAA family ATPase [Firmicutes bacterium]|nr:AAA family ATPase [Bacillota bacterium]
MVYLKQFNFPNEIDEHRIMSNLDPRRPRNSTYPLGLFSSKDFTSMVFDPITIIYGGNGSGKTTLLNIVSSKIGALRKNRVNLGVYFEDYVALTKFEMSFERPLEIKFISSDDVFDNILDIKAINAGINRNKEFLVREYIENKYNFKETDITNYESVKAQIEPRNKTATQFVRDRLLNESILEHSNGESALMYWEQEIKENSIYILDEPENSLSAANQIKLARFIEDSSRFYNCQFIISTHSPFLLALSEHIYDLDTIPVATHKWSDLENMRLYYDFFKQHENEFVD